MSSERIAVIGAGAGGLSAAKHLLGRGLDVTVFEAGSHIGGLWVYENDNGRSTAYASLCINSEARATHYLDFPFPEGTSLFPRHDEMRAYLEAYADHFDVRRRIRFNTEIAAVEPDGAGRWLVSSTDGPIGVFDGVVAAPGHQAAPSHPPFHADFAGEYLHAHDYRTPEPYRGKRVVVVGTGNSALDIAADICTVTAATTLAARSPVLIMPRLLFGVPLARTLAKLERSWVPWPVRRAFRVLLTNTAHGSMERWGFVTPKTRTHPASHPTLMMHVAYSRIEARPGIAGVEGDRVRFADGRVETYDTMIAATGYELDLPFVGDEIVPVRGRRVDLYKRIFPPGWPGLYFVGYFNVSGGSNIRMMDVQSRLVTAVAAGDVELPDPDEMHADIAAERDRLARLYPDGPRYELELDPKPYEREVAALLLPSRSRRRLALGARRAPGGGGPVDIRDEGPYG